MKIPQLILALLIATPFLHADSISLKNGTMVEGKYISTGPNGGTVTYEANGQTHTVPRSDIQSIVLERDGKTKLLPGFGPPKPSQWKYNPDGNYDGDYYERQPRRSHPHRYRPNRYGSKQQSGSANSGVIEMSKMPD